MSAGKRQVGKKRGGSNESTTVTRKRARVSVENDLKASVKGDDKKKGNEIGSSNEIVANVADEEETPSSSAARAGPARDDKVSNAVLYYNIVTTERPGKRKIKVSDYVMGGLSSDEDVSDAEAHSDYEDAEDYEFNPASESDDD